VDDREPTRRIRGRVISATPDALVERGSGSPVAMHTACLRCERIGHLHPAVLRASGFVAHRRLRTEGEASEALHSRGPRADIRGPPSIRVRRYWGWALRRLTTPPMQLPLRTRHRMCRITPGRRARKYPEVSHWVLAQQK